MLNLLKHFNSEKKDKLCFFSYHGVNDPRWTPCRYDSLVEEGFQKNVIAFRAITLVSRNVASIPITVKNLDTGEVDAELTALLNRPNRSQARATFLENVVNYLLISGNAFIYFDDIAELRCLRTDRMQIIPNKSKTNVDSYIYSVDSSSFSIDRENILHLKFLNPLNDWYGFSPLQIAFQAVDQYNAMSSHNLALLQNGGRPSGCLMVKNGTESLTSEQREQLRADIKNSYAGTGNAGKIMVLEGSFEWKEMGFSPRDLDFDAGKNTTAREISEAFGVPPVLLGIHGDATFTNYREARLHLWEDTILPLAEFIRLEFSNWLSQKFGKKIEISLDLDAIPALVERRESIWKRIANADFLTLDEKRELIGYPPIKEVTKEET